MTNPEESEEMGNLEKLAKLDKLLNSEDDTPVEILPDGTIREMGVSTTDRHTEHTEAQLVERVALSLANEGLTTRVVSVRLDTSHLAEIAVAAATPIIQAQVLRDMRTSLEEKAFEVKTVEPRDMPDGSKMRGPERVVHLKDGEAEAALQALRTYAKEQGIAL